MNEVQAKIIDEAMSWKGTPYHHAADVKGHGVDCAMLPVRVFCDLSLVPDFDPRPYPHDWHLHRSDEKYLDWVNKYAVRYDEPEPGDLALFRVGRCVAHGAIMISKTVMIHADLDSRAVVCADLSSWIHRCVGFWRVI